jgi:hypothetical protein
MPGICSCITARITVQTVCRCHFLSIIKAITDLRPETTASAPHFGTMSSGRCCDDDVGGSCHVLLPLKGRHNHERAAVIPQLRLNRLVRAASDHDAMNAPSLQRGQGYRQALRAGGIGKNLLREFADDAVSAVDLVDCSLNRPAVEARPCDPHHLVGGPCDYLINLDVEDKSSIIAGPQ